ncbi:hypothetical protein BJ165DRAFT_1342776, partial [Panaeolus papilionaceus]
MAGIIGNGEGPSRARRTSSVRAAATAEPGPATAGSATTTIVPAATAPTAATATNNATTTATAPLPDSNPTISTSSILNSTSSSSTGPYRDEDVLLSLQLLAYLSKYPHVRQAFYKPRVTFHPASVDLGSAAALLRVLGGGGRGKDKDKEKDKDKDKSDSSSSHPAPAPSSTQPTRQTNVFSLVERFTFKPSSSEAELANPPPRLPPEIQYWAGVIMRNACRKDDSRGGIRQCANMLCGKWETYPREFAKCRRCRKAKYCGKECQSTAWSEGHR